MNKNCTLSPLSSCVQQQSKISLCTSHIVFISRFGTTGPIKKQINNSSSSRKKGERINLKHEMKCVKTKYLDQTAEDLREEREWIFVHVTYLKERARKVGAKKIY